MPAGETLGSKLLKLRVASHLTQDEVARRAGVSVHNVRNWEHDRRKPGLGPAYRLAQTFGVPMEELAACVVAAGDNEPGLSGHEPDDAVSANTKRIVTRKRGGRVGNA